MGPTGLPSIPMSQHHVKYLIVYLCLETPQRLLRMPQGPPGVLRSLTPGVPEESSGDSRNACKGFREHPGAPRSPGAPRGVSNSVPEARRVSGTLESS